MSKYRGLAGSAVLWSVAALVLVATAGAQEETEQTRRIRHVQDRVQAALALTADQEALLRDLRDRLQDELQSIRIRVRDGDLSSYEGRLQLRGALQAQRQARDAVLSADQRALLDRARRYARGLQTAVPRPLGPEPLETNLVVALTLTETQQILWQNLIARQRAELAALEELGQAPTAGDIRQLRYEHRQAFEAMLTLVQRDELRRLRRKWHERQETDLSNFDMGWDLGEEPGLEEEFWDEPGSDLE